MQLLSQKKNPLIVIDGVIFQINNSGISRVWRSLFKEWSNSEFSEHILILNRAKTAPIISGLKYMDFEPYDYNQTATDTHKLQVLCDEVQADLFISTYYTTPLSTPSVVMVHDLIPEVIKADLDHPEWREKNLSILYAYNYLTVSENSKQDLMKFYPHISQENINVTYNGVNQEFVPSTLEEISLFRNKYQISKPYILLVGSRVSLMGYKNGKLVFEALNQYVKTQDIAVVCVGGSPFLEPELATLAQEITLYLLTLEDQELKTAYSGAIALIYPSHYEGFGLPIIEAMACGCPVITCHNSSIPEVAGTAALYVDEHNISEMIEALKQVQNFKIRQNLINAGFEQIKKFSWKKMAKTIAQILLDTTQKLYLKNNNQHSLIWRELRKIQAKEQQITSLNTIDSQSMKEMERLIILLKQKNEELSEYIQVLQQEIEYLSTPKAALKKILKTFLQKFGLLDGINRHSKVLYPIFKWFLPQSGESAKLSSNKLGVKS